jgi:predicted small secreted protein
MMKRNAGAIAALVFAGTLLAASLVFRFAQ